MIQLLAALLLAAAPAQAGPSGADVSSATVVAEVSVERLNVFDPNVPGEDVWFFRLANRLHYVTRENVVRRELLFGPGDRWDALKVIESERNLRANGSFRRAEIVGVPRPDGRLDAVVRTQDSWTTNPRFNVGTEGGENFISYGIEENNLLGYGKSVGFFRSKSGSKSATSALYRDPRFLGSRLGLGGSVSRTTDGDNYALSLSRPFYSLESDKAVSYSLSESKGEDSLVSDGEEFTRFKAARRHADAALGVRLSEDRLFVQRLEAGWYNERARFEPMRETVPGTLPESRELSGPMLGYSWVQPRYIKETYVERMERVEDFNLGNELRVRAGWMGVDTGSDRQRWIFNASEQQGYALAPGRFALAGVSASGRVLRGKMENGLVLAAANLYWKTSHEERAHTIAFHAEGSYGRAFDRENFLVLGGNSGLRGYKNNAFVGDKAVLFNLEDRFFFAGEWFHLARLGGAVFAESGAIAPEGQGLSWRQFKSDVGAGLRVGSTRSRSGALLRLDLAYALNRGPGGSRWVISILSGQAFSFANSAAQRVRTSPGTRL